MTAKEFRAWREAGLEGLRYTGPAITQLHCWREELGRGPAVRGVEARGGLSSEYRQ